MERTYALQLLKHTELLTRVLTFNATRARKARLQALPALIQHLSQGSELAPAGRTLLQQLYVATPNIKLFAAITHPQVPPFDLAHQYDRLQLISEDELRKLVLYLGVSRLAVALSHIVRVSELTLLKAVIPDAVLRFAQDYARFTLEPQLIVASWPTDIPYEQADRYAQSLGAELLSTLGPHFSAEDLRALWQERLTPYLPEQPAALTCSPERLLQLCTRILR